MKHRFGRVVAPEALPILTGFVGPRAATPMLVTARHRTKVFVDASGGPTAMPLPPQLDPAQRQAALEKAAAARRQRAELKEKLKAGSISLGELLAQGDTDDAVAKLKVVTVLESLPGVGKVKARRTMEELEISENRRVRGLGTHQRRALLEHFER